MIAALVPATAGAEFGINSAHPSAPEATMAAALVKEKAGRAEAVVELVELVVVEPVAEVQRSLAPSLVELARPSGALLVDSAGHWGRQAKREL